MRFALVGPLIEENLALGYLASALVGAGHRVEMVPFAFDRDHSEVARHTLASRPDAVGLSMTFQSRARGYLALAEDLRVFGFRGHITAGGHFASLAAATLLDNHRVIDSVIRGEAERALPVLAEALAGRVELDAVPGIVLRRGDRMVHGPRPVKCEPLDALAWPLRPGPPRRELGVAVAPMVASRGCRGRCAYCSIAAFGGLADGPARRERSPDDIVAEMVALHHERSVRLFVFHDDDFFTGGRDRDLARLDRLDAAMREAGLGPVALSIKARPDDVDRELFARLRELGLIQVVLGIDNDAPATLAALDRHLAPDAQARALTTLAGLDLSIGSNLLLWAPTTTAADVRHNLGLMRRFPDQLFNLGRAEPYEGAPLTARLAAAGRLGGSYLGRDYQLEDPVAERSWQLFRTTLGRRCYPADGLMQRAIRLHMWRRLVARLFPPGPERRLGEAIDALAARVAASTAAWLETLLEVAETYPADATRHDRRAAALADRVSTAIEVEDRGLLEAADLLAERLRAALGARSGSEARGGSPGSRSPAVHSRARSRLRSSLTAVGLYATCTCAACAGTGCVVQEPPQRPVAAAPQPAPAPEDGDRFAQPPPDDQRPPDKGGDQTSDTAGDRPVRRPTANAINLRLDAVDYKMPSCGGCSHAMGIQITSYRVTVEAPPELQLLDLRTDGGSLLEIALAPNRQRGWARLLPGGKPGNYQVIAIARERASGKEVQKATPFRVGDPSELRCEPGPCSDPPGPMPGDLNVPGGGTGKPTPPKLDRVGGNGKVVFTRTPMVTGRAPNGVPVLDFGVGVTARHQPSAQVTPEIECSPGHVIAVERGVADGLRDWFRVTYSPVSKDGGIIVAGDHTCVVRYQAPAGQRAAAYRAALSISVDQNGNPGLGPPPE